MDRRRIGHRPIRNRSLADVLTDRPSATGGGSVNDGGARTARTPRPPSSASRPSATGGRSVNDGGARTARTPRPPSSASSHRTQLVAVGRRWSPLVAVGRRWSPLVRVGRSWSALVRVRRVGAAVGCPATPLEGKNLHGSPGRFCSTGQESSIVTADVRAHSRGTVRTAASGPTPAGDIASHCPGCAAAGSEMSRPGRHRSRRGRADHRRPPRTATRLPARPDRLDRTRRRRRLISPAAPPTRT